ncbi:MAG TPA: RagB/SusD family nutrient uptake outer membrane protein [Gemmatimonadaceae bacterium]|nr:RagB/SusD family nutrient uptake outer membrane protein [Gemmatimonadaceae bacterium]
MIDMTGTALRRPFAALLLVAASACSRLTDVSAPDAVQLPSLNSASGAEALRIGSISGFALVYAGAELGQITSSGALADEFSNASTPVIALAIADIRNLPEPGSSYPYLAVQRSRLDARRAITALQTYTPDRRAKIGEQFALAAYTEIFLGENMCPGIPLGEMVDGNPVYGTPLSTDELFDHAIADFDSALAYSGDSVRVMNLARIGRARALLDRGRFADAAGAVVAVPTAYSYQLQYSAAQPNGVYNIVSVTKWITVADREGINGLNFRSANDPRVPTTFVSKGSDGVTDLYAFTRYSSVSSPIVLASGTEARLIEAEAMLKGGDSAGALQALNALRAAVPGLAPLTMQSTDAGRIDQLFRERAFWLFATGHRQGDLRRLMRQYGRASESVFPTGPYKDGRSYGTDVSFPPDIAQQDNPAFKGCTDRGA